ncbi:MAG: hypothetical protein OEN20_00200 [Gammaproteobacteria bacterium]|nr:hypothetical protein [Gammaproteobacteria bacterium]
MHLLKVFSRGVLLAPCFALVLYGCGGSGGGSSDSGNPDPTVQITRTNAGQVAATAYGTNGDLGEVAEIPTLLPFEEGGRGDALQVKGLAGVALLALRRSGLANAPVAPAVDDNGNCDVTGTSAFTFNDTNGNDDIDAGESGSVTFTGCVDEVNGPTINGAMTITVDAASETEVAFTLQFVNLTIVGGIDDENLSVSGRLSFGISNVNNTLVLTLSGKDLEIIEDGVPLNLAGDFDFTVSISGTSSTVEFAMTLNVPSLSGVIKVSTTAPLVGNPPQSGVLMVEGVDSTLILTFTGGGAVTVALDEDDDGTPECSQDLMVDTLDQFDPGVACI